MEPIGEMQIGPMLEIRFKADPPVVPGEKVVVQLAPDYNIVVTAKELGENGYTKGTMGPRWQ